MFPHRFLNRGFWARGRLYTASIGEKIKRSCSPSWKKSKLGVNWTAWAGAWDVMIRLLLASEVLGLLCSHIDWTAPIPTGSLRSQEIRARPDPRLFILGLERSLTKGVGGSRWWTEASLFTRIQGSCCCRYCCSCLPVLQGGFLACQPYEAPLTDGLESRVCPLLQRTRKKSTGAVRRSSQSCTEWTYLSFATLYTQAEDFCRHKPAWCFFFFSFFFYISVTGCTYFPLSIVIKFVRAVGVFRGVVFILFVSDETTRKYKEDFREQI